MSASYWSAKNVPPPVMATVAAQIEENALTYLKIGARVLVITAVCTSPVGEPRVDWNLMVSSDHDEDYSGE